MSHTVWLLLHSELLFQLPVTMSCIWSVLLMCNILSTAYTQQSNSQVNVYYVRPGDNSTYAKCPPSHCHTLAFYVSNANRYFASNTELIFLPGTHLLEGKTSSMHIANVSNLSLSGNSTSSERNQQSTIVCNGTGCMCATSITPSPL